MPLLTGLQIQRFPCFERLRIDGLLRVNAFVGRNNSGKTDKDQAKFDAALLRLLGALKKKIVPPPPSP